MNIMAFLRNTRVGFYIGQIINDDLKKSAWRGYFKKPRILVMVQLINWAGYDLGLLNLSIRHFVR